MNEFIQSLNNFKNDGLSIIITAYKSQEFIEECLDSIQNQNYFKYNDNYEILLGIDACETTLKKVNEIRSNYKNLKVFYASENGGTYRMRNSLWTRSRYENLLFFDSDDVMPSNFINDIMKYSSYKSLRFRIKTFKVINNKKVINDKVKISYGQMLIKKDIMYRVKGYYDERMGMDSDLINRVSKITFTNCAEVIFFQRNHNNSLTSSKDTGFGSIRRKKVCELIAERVKQNIIINKFIAVNKSVKRG